MNSITKNVLHKIVLYKGKAYLTSHYFHHVYRNENGGGKYAELKNFNKLIRSIETYEEYIYRGDIVELTYNKDEITGSDLEPVFKSTAYKPIMLISATAQIALTHHLDDEISNMVSVAVNEAAAIPDNPLLSKLVGNTLAVNDFKGYQSIALLTGLDQNESCLRANIAVRNDYGVGL